MSVGKDSLFVVRELLAERVSFFVAVIISEK